MKEQPELSDRMELPCGAVVNNRFLKSAMSEILGSSEHSPTEELISLYSRWAEGNAGILVTGNVMIDEKALGEPANVVISDDKNIELLKKWADAGKKKGNHIFVQLNHPGKQSPKSLSPEPAAPSAIPLGKGLERFFATPRELNENEIMGIIEKFAKSSEIVKKAGFTGVQIHAAHGYLVSQFLSPLHNKRADKWGGSLENRMRFLIEIYDAIRKRTGPDFPVSVKINSADFRRGGFTEEEAMVVLKTLDEKKIDLIELSGGSYESPVMTGKNMKSENEAYFLDIALKAKKELRCPVAVTGGFRTSEAMKEAVALGKTDFIGIGRPMAVDPDLPEKILSGQNYKSTVKPLSSGIKMIDRLAMLEITWYEYQIGRIARNMEAKPFENVWISMAKMFLGEGFFRFKRRRA
jgi:2,4-dienoyl-CoA reductase-like NADH-dependent reductase (Old Yellow Enzyme family)